jgi:hypothetical protein
MSEPLDPSATPLASVDPDSVTALFDADPALLGTDGPNGPLDRLITEMRRRADVAAAEAAAASVTPKTRKKSKTTQLGDAAIAAIIDKPVSELSTADLFAATGGIDP